MKSVTPRSSPLSTVLCLVVLSTASSSPQLVRPSAVLRNSLNPFAGFFPRLACPSTCPGDYSPVCGSDGSTYGNKCTLDIVTCRNPSITLAGIGGCTPSRTCPDVCVDVMQTVCGSNGITYPNECVFRAATCVNPSIAFRSTKGECETSKAPVPTSPSSCPVLCPAQYKPVCGTDGQTYPNQCVLDTNACDNPSLKTARQGECEEGGQEQTPIDTPTQVPQVGVSFPVTTPSTPSNVNPFIPFAPPPPRQPCPSICGRIYSPVCGSDGRTYFNMCLLQMTGCRLRRNLTVAYEGSCV